MTPAHDRVHTGLGAYVLGALEPPERAEVEAHLPDCAACRDALAELAALPGLLGRLSADEATLGGVAPPSGPVDRALQEVAHAQRSQRRRLRGWQALAAAAVIAAVAAVVPLWWSSPGLALEPRAVSQQGAQVEGMLLVTATDWGMEVELELRNLPAGRGYTLVAVAHDAHETTAASWAATETGEVRLTGSCYLPIDRLAHLEVHTSDGEVLTVFDVS